MPLFKFKVKDREAVFKILESIDGIEYVTVSFPVADNVYEDNLYVSISGGEYLAKSVLSEVNWKSFGIQAPQYMKTISVLELLSGK